LNERKSENAGYAVARRSRLDISGLCFFFLDIPVLVSSSLGTCLIYLGILFDALGFTRGGRSRLMGFGDDALLEISAGSF